MMLFEPVEGRINTWKEPEGCENIRVVQMKLRQGAGVKCTFYSHNTLYTIVTTEHIVVNSARNRHP
jgi:hypothetical protein